MTREEVKSMDLETFMAALPTMEDVHFLEADGTEVYGIYKHDVCYMEKDGIQRTLQMIVPEMKPDKSYVYPAILYVQGSAWMKQDNYKRLGVMARLAQRGYVTAILQYRESALASYPAPVEDAKTGVRFLRMHAEEYHIDPENIVIMGDSSGGHTALAAGLTADEDCLDGKIYPEVSCGVKAIAGKIATGDTFVGDAETKKAIEEKCHPDCVEMEGAAVSQIAGRNGVPCVILRAMSDNADESGYEVLVVKQFSITEYVKTATEIVANMIESL